MNEELTIEDQKANAFNYVDKYINFHIRKGHFTMEQLLDAIADHCSVTTHKITHIARTQKESQERLLLDFGICTQEQLNGMVKDYLTRAEEAGLTFTEFLIDSEENRLKWRRFEILADENNLYINYNING